MEMNHSGKANQLELQTPEGITFSLILAGPVTRFLAWLVDALCLWGLLTVLGTVLEALGAVSAEAAETLYLLGNFLIPIGYGILCEWGWRGQTLGKRLLKIRIVDAQGLKLRFSQVVIRNLLRSVDTLPLFYMVGGLACLLSPKAQRLGDLVANTVVIRHEEPKEPDLEQLLAGKFNSLRAYAHLCARLRQRVTPAQAAVVLQALLRRESLDPNERVELFADIAGRFRSMVVFPEEAVDGLSDEQYLRNVVDVLYNNPKAQGKGPVQAPQAKQL